MLNSIFGIQASMNPDYSTNPIQSPKTLKQRIMRRIYFFFMLRNVAPFAFDCFLIVGVGFLATLFVSVKDVFTNLSVASTDGGGFSQFSFAAFSHTELETKLLLLVLGCVAFLALRDLKRALKAVRTLRESSKPEAQSPRIRNPSV